MISVRNRTFAPTKTEGTHRYVTRSPMANLHTHTMDHRSSIHLYNRLSASTTQTIRTEGQPQP